MKFQNHKYLFLGCLVFISLPGLSEDQAWFQMVGFSEDGNYAAWQMGGVQDGSGFQWIDFGILSTESSEQMDRYYHVWDDYVDELPGETDLSSSEEDILELCRKYDIKPGTYDSPLVYHPLTDLSANGDSVFFCLETYSPMYCSDEILITVSLLPAEMEEGYPDWFPSPVTPILHVFQDSDSTSCLFFREEASLQRSTMEYDYNIAAVYRNPVIDNSLLVVLHSTRPGFEGPDGRFRVVCGSI